MGSFKLARNSVERAAGLQQRIGFAIQPKRCFDVVEVAMVDAQRRARVAGLKMLDGSS